MYYHHYYVPAPIAQWKVAIPFRFTLFREDQAYEDYWDK